MHKHLPMNSVLDFLTVQRRTFSSLELPYCHAHDDKHQSMLIFLPMEKSINALDNFIRDEFTEEIIFSAHKYGFYEKVDVQLPKMNFGNRYRITQVMRKYLNELHHFTQ